VSGYAVQSISQAIQVKSSAANSQSDYQKNVDNTPR